MANSGSTLPYRPCVGIMVLNKAGLVWIGKRAGSALKPPGGGSWWQMPQGGIDEGEEPAAAALRELHEETGISSAKIVAEMPGWQYYDLPPELIPQTWGDRYRGQKQKWFAMRFLEPDGEINIVPQQGHEQEFEEWQWVPFHDVERRVVPFKAHVYREVLNAFAGLARPGGA